MNKGEILKTLEELGIEISDKNEHKTCKLISHYNGNKGYFHIIFEDTELLLLKGVYKDFIRNLKGEANIPQKYLSKMSDVAALIERNVSCDYEIIFYIENEPEIADISPVEIIQNDFKINPFKLSKPLSNVEYKLSESDFASSNTLYTRGICSFFFPGVLNPLSASIFKNVLDILNPFFMHANFKTHSPSVKLIFNKVFANYKNLEIIFQTLKISEDFLHVNYAPHLYLKNKRHRFKNPDYKHLDISTDEIEEFINEIKDVNKNIKSDEILSDKFLEYLSLIVMTGEMILMLLIKDFIWIYNQCGDWSLTLSFIYKTRSDNIFSTDFDFLESFNLNAKTVNFKKINKCHPVETDELLKQFPFSARTMKKKQILSVLKSIHDLLNYKDDLYVQTNEFLKIASEIFIEIGKKLVDERKLKDFNDIFLLEIDEIKNILNDSFFGNTAFTKSFKYWQTQRFELQPVPFEIYEKDIRDVDSIVKKIYGKYEKINKIEYFSLFDKNIENEKQNYLILEYATLKDILKIKNHSGIITSVSSFFSYLTEFACINDIPLYTGIRYANYLLKDKALKVKKDFIEF